MTILLIFRRLGFALALAALALAFPAAGHEFKLDAVINAFVKIEGGEAHLLVRAPLYLFRSARFPVKGAEIDVAAATDATERAVSMVAKDITLFEDGEALAPVRARGRLTLPSDRSFETYTQAANHVAKPTDTGASIYIDQGFVDAGFVYPIHSPHSVFALRTTAGPDLGDYLKLTVRYLPEGGDARAMIITSSSGVVDLNPNGWGATTSFVALGIAHILSGLDHLLFLLCLVLPLRNFRQILAVVTTFTLAHSITLIGSAFDLAPAGAWFPPFVETAIAASIVFMAIENIVGMQTRRRLFVTGLFGLVHGFGFAYGLQQNFQFAGDHLVLSLFAFNAGIEIGQICVLALMVPALALVRRHILKGRVGIIVMSALVAHMGWHWMVERYDELARFRWPRPTAGDIALAAWIIVAIVAALAARRWLRSRSVVRRHALPQTVAKESGGD